MARLGETAMTNPNLAQYRDALQGCRFCPMCKPAGEVHNLTQFESHSTRARAMQIWRALEGMSEWTPRHVELLFQSTLDSISEAWCVGHYPVSGFMAEARAVVVQAGLTPEAVRGTLARPVIEPRPVRGAVVLLGGEAADITEPAALDSALRMLRGAGVQAEPLVAATGALAYSLGDRQSAALQLAAVAQAVADSGAKLLVADGPQTLWAWQRLAPLMEVAVPDLEVAGLSQVLADAVRKEALPVRSADGMRVLLHDGRSAALVADRLAAAEAIQPGYSGAEEKLGTGAVYEAPRYLVDRTGALRLFSRWSRALARSSGADDGLWMTYPDLADGLAHKLLQEAKDLGAEVMVTDSLLSAKHLFRSRRAGEIATFWLPEWLGAG